MKRLQEKLHSQSGASILMALLMFLVCCMVAASVLAAAASNAGKYRSNRVEQQKYLTLSSAIQLVADEIQQAEYTWQYTVYEWDVTVDPTYDSEGNMTSPGYTDYYFFCEQNNKTYTCGDLTDQIPLKKSLDGELSKQFKNLDGTPRPGYNPLSNTVEENTTTCTLLVTLPDGLTGYPDSGPAAYQVPKEATVHVKLDHATHHITLTAWLGTKELDADGLPKDKSETMIAELVAEKGTAPLLTYNNPAGRKENSSHPPWGTETSKTMTWTLHWIKKGAA